MPQHWQTEVNSDSDSANSPGHLSTSDDEPDTDEEEYILPAYTAPTQPMQTASTPTSEEEEGPHDDPESSALFLPDGPPPL